MSVAPVLSVQPTRALVDEKFQIFVRNLLPRQRVTIHSLHQSEAKDYWEAFGQYTSNEGGTVSVSEDASSGGTYTGVEPMGLLWSMRPVPGSTRGLRLRKSNVISPMVVSISVFSDHMTQGFSEKDALATVVTERWYLAPGVQRVDVRERGVKGTFFIPSGPGPFPAVLDMWGGGGGLVEYRAALLASHGFLTMALDYLSVETNQTIDSEIEYFEVCPDRVAVLGLSVGAIAAFRIAARSQTLQCCVCMSGYHAHQINMPIFEMLESMKWTQIKPRIDEDNTMSWREALLPIPTEQGMKLDVGQIKCSLLIVVGQDDQNWPTVEAAEDIQQMMDLAGNGHLLTVLSYPEAGHLIEPPYTPHARFSKFIIQKKTKMFMLWGGQTKPHAVAQEDSWTKILHFLHTHLYKDTIPAARL